MTKETTTKRRIAPPAQPDATQCDRAPDALTEFMRELTPLFEDWHQSGLAIGQKLYAARDRIGQGGIAALIQTCHARWPACSHAQMWVWYRVAAGEIPESLTRTSIHPSVLQHMAPEVAAGLAEDPEVVVSSSTLARAVRKRISEMTREECKRQIRPQGFVPIDEAEGGPGVYRYCRATGISIDERKNRVLLRVESQQIVVFASAKSLQKALEKLVARARS